MNAPSVVILTSGRVRELDLVLRGLGRQTLAPGELLLVEDLSAGERSSGQLDLAALPFPVRVLEAPEGGSFAEARNLGVREAAGEAVAFLDDDCEPDSRWLERLVGALERNSWLAAGGTVLPAEELTAPPGYSPRLAWLAGLTVPGFFGDLGGRRHLPMTANLAARRETFLSFPFHAIRAEHSGGGSVYERGREDAQWWRTLRRAGRPVGCAPRAIVWHHIDASRLEWDRLEERAEADGRAHWRREKLQDELPSAARDLLHAPGTAIIESLQGSEAPAQSRAVQRIWATRQWSLLGAAVDDYTSPVTPATRLRLLSRAAAALGASGARALVRHTAATGYHALARGADAPLPEAPRSILFVLHDFLGDGVLAMPAVRQLAAARPETKVTVLTGPSCAPLLRASLAGLPENVRPDVLEVPRHASGRTLRAAVRLHAFLRPLAPGAIVVAYLHGLHPAPFFLLNARVIAWPEDNGFHQRLYGELLARPVAKSFRKSELAALLDLLAPLGVATRLERPRVEASTGARARVERILNRAKVAPGSYAVLHVEAAGRFKFWPPEHFGVLAEALSADGVPIFLEGSPAGRGAVEAWAGKLPRCWPVHGLLNSDELTALLEGAALFVGADSGPSHIAQATGTPSVLLFGMSEVHRWGPVPGKGVAPAEVLAAAPGNWLEEEAAGLPADHGMRLLSVDRVVEAAMRLIAGGKRASEGYESR